MVTHCFILSHRVLFLLKIPQNMSDLLCQFIEVLKQTKDAQFIGKNVIAEFNTGTHNIRVEYDSQYPPSIHISSRSRNLTWNRRFSYLPDTNTFVGYAYYYQYTTPCVIYYENEYVFALVRGRFFPNIGGQPETEPVTLLNGETGYIFESEPIPDPIIVFGSVPIPPK